MNPRSHLERRTLREGLGAGLLTAAILGTSITAYAYLSPATYRASSVIRVDPASGSVLEVARASEASLRLRRALVQSDPLDEVTSDASSGSRSGSLAAFEVESVDARRFEVSVTDASARRAAQLADLLAERAIRAAPRVLGVDRTIELAELRSVRQRTSDALVRFLSAHPELTSPKAEVRAQSTVGDGSSGDAKLDELRAERARIKLRLAPRTVEGENDNPYSNPSTVDAETPELERRLTELNAKLATAERQKAPLKLQAAPDLALTEELARLSRVATEAKTDEEAAERAAPSLTARIVARAATPDAPVSPNRPLLLLWGALAALIAGAAAAVWRRRAGGPVVTPRQEPDAGPEVGERVSVAPPSQPVSEPAKREASEPPAWAKSDEPPEAGRPASGLELATTQQAVLDAILFPSESSPFAATAAALEVQKSEVPPASARRARPAGPVKEANKGRSAAGTTQVLGSPIEPVLPPPLRGAPASGSRARQGLAQFGSDDGYTSTAPRGNVAPDAMQPPPSSISRTAPLVQCERVEAGWRPDASLVPTSHRSLRDELWASAVGACSVVLLAGPSDAGDEKSRVAAELSLALAERGDARVLLLEGNLRCPQAHRFLRIAMPRGSGFSAQLRARVAEGAGSPWTVVECTPTLHALCESEALTAESMLGQAFENCVKELRESYDLIVIDGPFTSDVAACRAVEDVVDTAIFVHLRSKASEAAEARSLFPGKRVALIAAAG